MIAKNSISKKIFANIIVVLFFTCSDLFAQGDLLVNPRRIVFDGSKRVYELNLANTGSDTARYNISFIQYRMTEDGSFQEITEPEEGQFFADKNLRFFPRSVTLAPNEAQIVKMQVVNYNNLKQGEYRSHAYFRAVPKPIALGSESVVSDSAGLSIQLVPIFGITIPVIIRVGENNTKSALSDLIIHKEDDTTMILEMKINRSGNMSTYGDLRAFHISPEGKETPVGGINGIAVYTPTQYRIFKLPIKLVNDINFNSGRLKVEYLSQADTKQEKLAVLTIDL